MERLFAVDETRARRPLRLANTFLAATLVLSCAAHSSVSAPPDAPRAATGLATYGDHGEPISLESVAGCYELSLGEWEPPLRETAPGSGNETILIAPSRVQLSLEPSGSLNGITVRRIHALSALSEERATVWFQHGPSAVTLVFTNGFSGLTLELYKRGEDLAGSATSFWDFPLPKQTAAAEARRIVCPAADGGAGQ